VLANAKRTSLIKVDRDRGIRGSSAHSPLDAAMPPGSRVNKRRMVLLKSVGVGSRMEGLSGGGPRGDNAGRDN